MSTEQPEAPAIPRLVTQEELAGYFKRLRFTDPRDAAANAFAEIQAHREPAPDPLIMPDGEFQATRTVAEALRLASGPPATEHGEAVTAVRRGLDLAAPFAGDDPRIIAAARQALRVLSGEETGAGPGAAATAPAETTLAEAAYGASAADAEWARTHPAGPAWTRPPIAQVCRLIETDRKSTR